MVAQRGKYTYVTSAHADPLWALSRRAGRISRRRSSTRFVTGFAKAHALCRASPVDDVLGHGYTVLHVSDALLMRELPQALALITAALAALGL